MKQELRVKNQGVRKSRAVRVWVILVVVLNSLFLPLAPVLAYESLRQTDWSGGYGQQIWSDNTKFNEHYHVDYQTPGELKIPGNNTWYNSAWRYKKKITFNNIDNGEVTHFPVLIKLDHKTNIDYRKTQNKTGNDIRFTDSDGITLIPHDIERWDQEGFSYIWVKVPKIDASSDSDYIYMYYGNPDASSGSNSKEVFSNKFVTVYHLNETPQPEEIYYDATGNKDATFKGNQSSEGASDPQTIFGIGHKFNGSDSVLQTADTYTYSDNAFTVSTWINTTVITSFTTIAHHSTTGTSTAGWRLHSNGTNPNIRFLVTVSGTNRVATGSKNIFDGKWHHVAATYDGSSVRTYVDGNSDGITTFTSSTITQPTTRIRVGSNEGPPDDQRAYFEGLIDEFRLAYTARDSSWIKAEYRTGVDELVSFGHEELLGSELISSIFDASHGTNWGYLSYTADEPEKTSVKVKVRTGNNMYMSDAPDFEVCDSITNKSDISTNNCVTDGHRYIQYQVILDTTESGKTPIFKSIFITDFLPHPVVKGISTQSQVTHSTSSGQASHQEQENIKPKPTAQAGPRPSPSPMQNSGFLQPVWDFFEALVH